jgi:succinyl-CoA synthetase beta subunit
MAMARLYEYQGKQLLRGMGLRVPQGCVASTPAEAEQTAAEIGKPVVVKAQIWATGRLKAGGIHFAVSPEEAGRVAEGLIGSQIKGFQVERVLVEEKLGIEKEYYAGVIVDDSHEVRAPVVVFSTQGGVDIEEVAKKSPDKIARKAVDISRGIRAHHVCDLALELGLSGDVLMPISRAICSLYELFRCYDAQSAEINPLVLTRDGDVVAADCRISIDDASVSRHPELEIAVPRESDRPPTELDRLAWKIEENDYRGVSFFAQLAPEIKSAGYIARSGHLDTSRAEAGKLCRNQWQPHCFQGVPLCQGHSLTARH